MIASCADSFISFFFGKHSQYLQDPGDEETEMTAQKFKELRSDLNNLKLAMRLLEFRELYYRGLIITVLTRPLMLAYLESLELHKQGMNSVIQWLAGFAAGDSWKQEISNILGVCDCREKLKVMGIDLQHDVQTPEMNRKSHTRAEFAFRLAICLVAQRCWSVMSMSTFHAFT